MVLEIQSQGLNLGSAARLCSPFPLRNTFLPTPSPVARPFWKDPHCWALFSNLVEFSAWHGPYLLLLSNWITIPQADYENSLWGMGVGVRYMTEASSPEMTVNCRMHIHLRTPNFICSKRPCWPNQHVLYLGLALAFLESDCLQNQ